MSVSRGPGTVLEFFAGIGLARMGLERAGWRVVFANDIDAKKRQMHEGHWGPDPSYVLGSVFDLDPAAIPSAGLAWASFPCVDLSLAGNRAGLSGDSSGAYWGFFNNLQLLGDRRPPLVVIENVPGMLTSRGGADMAEIVSGLNELGYQVDMLLVDASHFVPQSRPRLFVVGVGGPYRLETEPEAVRSAVRPDSVLTFMEAHPTLRWGVAPTGSFPTRGAGLAEALERFPEEAGNWWNDGARDRLVSQMSPRHLEAVQALSTRAERTFATVYRRVRRTGCMAEVRFDGIAGCLRTPRGGSSRQFVLELGGGRVAARHMTAIEYGRLQGAGEFKITVPTIQALFGFGDAVCVPAVEWLAVNVLNPIVSSARGGPHG